MATESIKDKIERSRTELLDLSLRNPLLNYKLLGSKGAEAVGAHPAEVFETLARDRASMRFLDAKSKSTAKNRLRTAETAEQLERRLLKTYTDARTLIEEQGVNTLFIALGMVRWREAYSDDTERKAPLILLPVSLDRANVNAGFTLNYSGEDIGANIVFMQKAKNDFDLYIPEPPDDESDAMDLDITAYFVEVERAIERMKGWSVDCESVALGFFSFSKLLMYQDLDADRWREGAGPDENNIVRALFQDGFREAKSAIGDDDHLDDHLKAEDAHHVVDADSSQAKAIHDVNSGRNLVIQGPPGTGKSQTITNIIAESVAQGKTILFVAEKMAALEVVKRRLDNIGVGAACLELHSHKTQKRAVIDELRRTLELAEPSTEGIDDDFVALNRIRNELNEYAEAVNTPVGNTGITPYHAYGELIRNMVGRNNGAPLPRLRVRGMDSWSFADYQRKADVVSELQTLLGSIGVLKNHIFRGSKRRFATPQYMEDLDDAIASAIHSLDALSQISRHLSAPLGLDTPSNIAQVIALIDGNQATSAEGVVLQGMQKPERRQVMRELLNWLDIYDRLHAQYDATLKPESWNVDVSDIHSALSANSSAFGSMQTRQYRSSWAARNLMSTAQRRAMNRMAALCRIRPPGDVQQQAALVKAILDEQEARRGIARLAEAAEATLGDLWRGEKSDWTSMRNALKYEFAQPDYSDDGVADSGQNLTEQTQYALASHRRHTSELSGLLELDDAKQFGNANGLGALPFIEQERILTQWQESIGEIRDMAAFNLVAFRAFEEDLATVAELAWEWDEASERLLQCFENARYNAIISRAIEERRSLAGFSSNVHRRRIEQFRAMDELALAHNRARVAHAHWSEMPRQQGGQLGILTREFAKQRRHLPVRQLLERAGSIIQAIKPVFMMSPLSVATYLKPGGVKFDLVVFDEASQVKPVDALGALLRAEQAVVVGDDKQLPPTDFFDAAIEGDDENSLISEDVSVTADMESILSLFYAQGAPARILRWHYRSRHESLIAVSNSEFYNNRLIAFPSPQARTEGLGLQYQRLDTHYGGGGVNREEAQQVAAEVMRHAKRQPRLSLGVATFSAAQRDAVQSALEAIRRQDDSCEDFFNAHPDEPFFIKNLENVQGDERDVIFISVAYGRNANGRVSQNFGPLNQDGGERRLNVLISRAKRRCDVFTNLRSDDIRLDENSKQGVKSFRKFLAYAERAEITYTPFKQGTEGAPPFQQEIADMLRTLGYEIHEDPGAIGFFVDIGVVDPKSPGRYTLGIECDGASYHNSRSARERDRLSEAVLAGLGWRLHRVWSVDWFNNPQRELERAAAAIEETLASKQN
jgi:hypothetical protein